MGSSTERTILSSSMPLKIIVFDFDGTLIDSNQIKYDAFFKLFPRDGFHHKIITEVLDKHLEESRYVILKKILNKIKKSGIVNIDDKINVLAEEYNSRVVSEAKICKEKPGAKKTLDILGRRFPLYLSSTTPETALKDIVKDRNWDSFFCDIFGYPREKTNTLLEIMRNKQVNAEEVLVVGDGESDRLSASETGCRFFSIEPSNTLETLLRTIKDI